LTIDLEGWAQISLWHKTPSAGRWIVELGLSGPPAYNASLSL
jgi:hypothetical protein